MIRKKRELGGIRVGLVEPEVRPSFSSSYICPVFQHVGPSMLCNMLGERSSSEFAVGAFERSPPHLFLYLLLFKRKTKVETKGTLPGLNTEESNSY